MSETTHGRHHKARSMIQNDLVVLVDLYGGNAWRLWPSRPIPAERITPSPPYTRLSRPITTREARNNE